ncbi:universal stress protein [Polaribacter tangerinus]|uniref:universal stress protein n=1 Tax=Polaribacter tangerinus TaxID=1920034 RepID=UPI000B4B645D|nr:universal stress protein [Polaribacter tangerinus]
MKHILVPIGATESAQKTLQYAIDFASEINAKVYVFRAYNVKAKAGTIINIDSIIARETSLYLRAIVSACNTKNVDIKLISVKGGVVDSVHHIVDEIGVDLIIVGAKNNTIKEELFLGKTAGKLVKQTNIPLLVIPENYEYQPIKNVLMAFKSGVVKSKTVLNPLKYFVNNFGALVHLLLVKTPNYTEDDLVLDANLENLKTTLTVSENATTFQGVLEHVKTQNPDMICVYRRKRGFFNKLWEKNTILKEEFYSNVPLLVLKGR